MSVFLFGVETWAKVTVIGMVVAHRREPGRDVQSIRREVGAKVKNAIESNARAYKARYGAMSEASFDHVRPGALRHEIDLLLLALQSNTAALRLQMGGGIAYNCDEDPKRNDATDDTRWLDDAIADFKGES